MDIENDEYWLWFLQNLHRMIETQASQLLQANIFTLLFDRQKNLLDDITTIFPNNSHDYCMKHLEANFHKKFKNIELKTFLWKIVCAIIIEEFDKAFFDMRAIDICFID